jgi:hypothetical protein
MMLQNVGRKTISSPSDALWLTPGPIQQDTQFFQAVQRRRSRRTPEGCEQSHTSRIFNSQKA